MDHIGQRCQALSLIISAWRQFPPGARIAGSLIYFKTRGMVGYTVNGWISPTQQGNSLRCVSRVAFLTKWSRQCGNKSERWIIVLASIIWQCVARTNTSWPVWASNNCVWLARRLKKAGGPVLIVEACTGLFTRRFTEAVSQHLNVVPLSREHCDTQTDKYTNFDKANNLPRPARWCKINRKGQ